MEEVLENPFPLVLLVPNKMVLSAILFVRMVIMVLVLFAGKVALLASLILALIVSSLHLMEEELVMLSGTKVNVNMIILKDARNMVLFTIPNARMASTMSAAVFALPIVPLDGLILESPAKRVAMEEVLAPLLCALLIKMKTLDCATRNAITDTRESDLSAGLNVLPA